ncbi:inner membrane protein YpjD [Psychrobacter sp. FDAARGOS_221]|uniref:cytochrome C assembly family protein n=1 Tax=Psychrobacter sp. FDAARGOS_221 TaxID=1975705 RepID=UPI000BB58B14|nr:cytochrome c biogenesis protein CcsA [Psychrobacter sp. FDAARGOS_221]PNK60170.1 cytochrome C assembly protein [Psychrobacter sp. FDAARGOS_221]
MLLAYLIALIVYTLVGCHLLWALLKMKPIAKGFTIGMLLVGLVAHAITIYPHIFTLYGLNFNLFNTASLISFYFTLFYVMFSFYRPVLSLGVFATPLAVIGLSLGYFGVAPYAPLTDISAGLELHIILSIAAYCMLLMAAVQALIVRIQIRELKHKTKQRFWVDKLPPLQSMESLLFDMILVGFTILTVALAVGFVYVSDLLGQHIVHKTVFSIISWLLFGALLVGHWKYGWRGRRAANMTIWAFILLAIGFIGSKFVLEMLL